MDADIHVPKKLRQLGQIDAYTKRGKASLSAPRGIGTTWGNNRAFDWSQSLRLQQMLDALKRLEKRLQTGLGTT